MKNGKITRTDAHDGQSGERELFAMIDVKDWRPKVVEGLLTRVVDDELVVLDRQHEQIHRLNALSVFIVDRCDGTRSEQAIIDAIVERYDVERPVAAADAEAMIVHLRTLGILV